MEAFLSIVFFLGSFENFWLFLFYSISFVRSVHQKNKKEKDNKNVSIDLHELFIFYLFIYVFIFILYHFLFRIEKKKTNS